MKSRLFAGVLPRVIVSLLAIVSLLMPDVAMAATAYDSLPSAQRFIPAPTKMAYLSWAQGHADYRLNYSLSRTRTTVYYIAQGTNNSATGLSTSVPRLCATTKDINDFIAATDDAGNVEYKLRRGDTWRATNSLNTGVVLSVAGTTLSSYAPAATNRGDAAPELTGFKAAYGASGWTDETGGVWSRTEATPIYWVRGGDAANLASFLATPYTRFSSGADAAAKLTALQGASETRAWFWDDATDKLYVKTTGAAELARVEACVGTGKGVSCLDVDDLLVRDINVTGFGMQTDNSQNYLLHSIATGTNQHTFYRCGAWMSAHHAVGQYSSPAGDGTVPGGIVIFYGCRFGLGIHHSSGSTMGVGYNGDGGQEIIFAYNVVTHGALRTESYRTELGYGIGLYSHTSGTYKTKLALFLHNLYADPATNKLAGCSDLADIDQLFHNSRREWSKYRGHIIGDRTLGRIYTKVGLFNPFGYYSLKVNCFYQLGAETINAQGAYSVTPQFGAAVNCTYDIDVSNITTAATFALLNAPNTSPHSYDIINCHFRLAGKATQIMAIDRDSPEGGQSLTCSAYNSIFEFNGSEYGHVNLPNADCRTAAGGMAGCAYSGIRRADAAGFLAGWSASGAPTDMAGEFMNLLGGAFRAEGVPLPTAIGYLEFDRTGKSRGRTLYIGPGDSTDIPTMKFPPREYRQAG